MKKIIFISLLFVSFIGYSQSSGVGINSTGVNPDPSAGLDIDFTDKGMLIPRLTTIQRDGIQNPAIGLQIYNTTTDCLQIYTPLSGWKDVVCDCQMTPSSSAFTFTDSLSNNSNVVFTATTAGLSYSWTFQNGIPSTSNLQSDTVTWVTPGVYAVTLTVTDNVGCMASTTDSVTVVACPPPLAVSFTNCSQTGTTGPSQGQCNSAYTGTPLANNVTVITGIQEWTVPFTGTYQIEVAGAKGESGGAGAIMKGTFPLTQGQQLRILVGQQGTSSYGGGGGTFVVSNSAPLIVAGGGGGYSSGATKNGSTNTSGNAGEGGAPGGTNGSGGSAGGGSYRGSGGGGYLGNGANGYYAYGGIAFVNGGNGAGQGGFGGGGGYGWLGGGGGGGYSGGGGGYSDGYSGGGGGSYIEASATNVSTSNGLYNSSSTFNGSSITNSNSYNSGHGYVNITLVCP